MSAPRLAPAVVRCLDCGRGLMLSASRGRWAHVYRPRNGHAPRPAVERAARDVRVGDRVRVLGLGRRRRVSFAVELVEHLEGGDLSLGGRNERGAWSFRAVAPLARVEVLPCTCAAPDPQVDGFCACCASVVAP